MSDDDLFPTIHPSSAARGRVLIPIDEQNRREISAEAEKIVIGFVNEHKDMPLRYDPPPHIPRKPASPISFYNGSGTPAMRQWYERRKHD